MRKPIINELYTDNGMHDCWQLIDPETGVVLWDDAFIDESGPIDFEPKKRITDEMVRDKFESILFEMDKNYAAHTYRFHYIALYKLMKWVRDNQVCCALPGEAEREAELIRQKALTPRAATHPTEQDKGFILGFRMGWDILISKLKNQEQ